MPTRRPRRAPPAVAQPPQAPASPRPRAGTTPRPGALARPSSEPRRVNRGYKLRADLAKECKRLAVEEERPLYEIMEEALEMYLARKAKGPR